MFGEADHGVSPLRAPHHNEHKHELNHHSPNTLRPNQGVPPSNLEPRTSNLKGAPKCPKSSKLSPPPNQPPSPTNAVTSTPPAGAAAARPSAASTSATTTTPPAPPRRA